MNNTFEKIFFGFLIILIVSFFGVFIFLIYEDLSSEKFSLRKDMWACSLAHSETSTQFIDSGGVLVPVTNTQKICDQWTKNRYQLKGSDEAKD